MRCSLEAVMSGLTRGPEAQPMRNVAVTNRRQKAAEKDELGCFHDGDGLILD